jgi:predicted nucleic acid-binding protein
MTGSNVLLDTNVIILASKGALDLNKMFNSYDNFHTSIICYMEVYGYVMPENERRVIDTIFDNITIQPIDTELANLVIQFKVQNRKKIKLPDAIILATAKQYNLTLLSDDWDNFVGIDDAINISDISFLKP